MNELSALTAQRDEILAKIRDIEAGCEGIENENNARRVQELNLSQAQLLAEKQGLLAQLSVLEGKLAAINSELTMLSGTGVDKILEAIKNQRWFFIKSKPKVLLDRETGYLWANLNCYNVCKNDNMDLYNPHTDYSVVKTYDFDGFKGWDLPTNEDFLFMIDDTSFPFCSGTYHYIKNQKGRDLWNFMLSDCAYQSISLDCNYGLIGSWPSGWLPYTKVLVENTDYKNNIYQNNAVYTEKERLQFTLDLFVQNELWPIFNDDNITQLYKKIYFEKPVLLTQLQDLQTQIEGLQTITLLSSEFDYKILLSKYDVSAINSSIIKYYKAVQQWIDELLEKLSYYENKKANSINEFNVLCMPYSRKYTEKDFLTEV